MNFEALQRKGIRNYEGEEAFGLLPELELYTAVVTSSLSPLNYEGIDERVTRIAELVGRCDKMFVAKLAVYTRREMNMRSVPLLLIVELARHHGGDDLVSRVIDATVSRTDEIMELLACYQWRNPCRVSDRPEKRLARLSHQIKKGLQRAFNRFDEYQFAKYNRAHRSVKLRDALFLVHPKPKDESQQRIFDKIASNSLATPYTWETELSVLGQKRFETEALRREAFTAKWTELINSGRLGYMAILRNLRNILECRDLGESTINNVIDRLTDREQVAASRQFPFRFLAAYREIAKVDSPWTPNVMAALETAVKESIANLSFFSPEEKIVIASDVSWSMDVPVSPRSAIHLYDIGMMLAMMLKSRCKSVISGIFGEDWKVIDLPGDNILANVETTRDYAAGVGYSTNGYKVLDYLIENAISADKIMMFTDMQMWHSSIDGRPLRESWEVYKRRVAPGAKLYLFDLAGYGESPLSLEKGDVWVIGGWSEKIFDVLDAVEKGGSALSVIKGITL